MTKVNYAGTGRGWEGVGRWVQANLSSGKCIQMNVVILSNILRDAAADVADAAVAAAAAAAAAQDTRTTFQWQPGHATNSGTRQRRRQLNTCT